MDTLAARYKVQTEMNLKRTPVTPSNTGCYVFAPVLPPTIGFTEYRFLFLADPIYLPFKPYLSALQMLSICSSNAGAVQML